MGSEMCIRDRENPPAEKPNRDLRKRRLSDKEEPRRQERDSFSECGCRGEICRKYRQRYLRAKTEAPRKADGRSLIEQEGRFQQAEAETKKLVRQMLRES